MANAEETVLKSSVPMIWTPGLNQTPFPGWKPWSCGAKAGTVSPV